MNVQECCEKSVLFFFLIISFIYIYIYIIEDSFAIGQICLKNYDSCKFNNFADISLITQ